MALILTEDQRFIREEARRLLAARSGSARVRSVVEAGTGFDADLWTNIAAEMGWCAMTIPEDQGGLNLGATELVLLMEAVGERLAPLPLWSTICLAVPLLMAVGGAEAKDALLPRIAAGEVAATVALALDGTFGPTVTASRVAGGYVLEGRVPLVTDAGTAEVILLGATLDDAPAWFALERGAGQEVRLLGALDATRQVGEVTLDGLHVSDAARVDDGAPAPGALDAALAMARLGLAAEQVGAARAVMDMTLAYIGERVQFGRTIASFQAVKHVCARLEVDLAEARALIYGAAAEEAGMATAEGQMDIAGARVLAGDLLFRAAEAAIQLHGGVGFTWEYDPHLYFKRAQASRALLGDPDDQIDRIAAHLLGEEARA